EQYVHQALPRLSALSAAYGQLAASRDRCCSRSLYGVPLRADDGSQPSAGSIDVIADCLTG
ncbi:MAG: hypothetical protein WEE03_03515, partial [Chloroflexota bacterium]